MFVHVLDPEGEQLWDDDHLPPTPTSQLEAGRDDRVHADDLRAELPLHRRGERPARALPAGDARLPLSGTEASRREYVVAKFQILPQSENIFLIYKDGWHPAEVAADNPPSEWQWTKKRGHDLVPEPEEGRDVLHRVRRPGRLFTPPQQVTVLVGGQPIGDVLRRHEGEEARDVSRSRPPSSGRARWRNWSRGRSDVQAGGADPRELGIRVFHTFIEPK